MNTECNTRGEHGHRVHPHSEEYHSPHRHSQDVATSSCHRRQRHSWPLAAPANQSLAVTHPRVRRSRGPPPPPGPCVVLSCRLVPSWVRRPLSARSLERSPTVLHAPHAPTAPSPPCPSWRVPRWTWPRAVRSPSTRRSADRRRVCSSLGEVDCSPPPHQQEEERLHPRHHRVWVPIRSSVACGPATRCPGPSVLVASCAVRVSELCIGTAVWRSTCAPCSSRSSPRSASSTY